MVALQKYQNKKIAIYGMGLTGFSAAKTFAAGQYPARRKNYLYQSLFVLAKI